LSTENFSYHFFFTTGSAGTGVDAGGDLTTVALEEGTVDGAVTGFGTGAAAGLTADVGAGVDFGVVAGTEAFTTGFGAVPVG